MENQKIVKGVIEMAEILDIKSVKEGAMLSDAVVYIPSYKKLTKKDGKSFYIAGTFSRQEDSLNFKVWDSSLVEAMSNKDLQGNVVKISGTVSSYMNVLEVKLTSIALVGETEFPKSLFLKSANVTVLEKEFTDFLRAELSENGFKLLMGIFNTEKIYPRFREEFAGSIMHDAQIGGLLNHSMKMLRIAKCVYENEPRMANLPNFKDLLMLSVTLHDVGKIYEMNLGVYQKTSFVTHRILGIELLVKYKSQIISLFDEDFYYKLVSVLQGHHGKEFGDAPTTIVAFIVHLIDMLDSQATSIFDRIERNDVTQRAGNTSVYVESSYLVV